jgi:zinc transport system permease protein
VLDIFSNPFVVMAAFASLLSSIASGIMGTYVVIKRIVFIAGSISHALLGGIGVCIYLYSLYPSPIFYPLNGALVSSLLAAGVIGWVYLKHKDREDTAIAAIWTIGMSVGIIFASITPGYNVELMNYLFGNILWASMREIKLLICLDVLLLLAVFRYRYLFLAISYNEKQARLNHVPVDRLYLILLALVAITVVILIQAVGAILLIAFLCLPAAVAGKCTKSIDQMMAAGVGFCTLFSFIGILLSATWNIPLGATIALVCSTFYFILLLIKKEP